MKGDKANYPVSLWPLLVAVLIGIALMNSADADNHRYQPTETTTNTLSGGDVNTGGNRSYGVGGADYDIANGTCRVHHGGLTIAIATFDEYCQGMGLIDRGMVNAGVRHICKQSPVGENYANYDDCETELKEIFARPGDSMVVARSQFADVRLVVADENDRIPVG